MIIGVALKSVHFSKSRSTSALNPGLQMYVESALTKICRQVLEHRVHLCKLCEHVNTDPRGTYTNSGVIDVPDRCADKLKVTDNDVLKPALNIRYGARAGNKWLDFCGFSIVFIADALM